MGPAFSPADAGSVVRPVAPSAAPAVGVSGERVIRVWFQHRETGDTAVGRITYRNPQLDDSLMTALFACWDAAPDSDRLDFLIATDGEGRAVVTQKALYSYSLTQVRKATKAYVERVSGPEPQE